MSGQGRQQRGTQQESNFVGFEETIFIFHWPSVGREQPSRHGV
jgi:hypothetical protein